MAKTPIYYFPLGTVSGIIASVWISLVVGCLGNVKILIDLLLYRIDFLKVKDRTGRNRPKLLDKYGSHRFVRLKKQNIKLHCVESGHPSQPLMLFVHGFPECWLSWRQQIEEFSQDYHVIALNMRGYGDSDKPHDIIELIETLLAKSKTQSKCILVAHDWGGFICWSVAKLRPDLIDRFIVLNAPPMSVWQHQIATTWRQFVYSLYIFYFNIPYLAELFFTINDLKVSEQIFKMYCKPEEIEVYKYYFSKPNEFTCPLNYYRAVLRGYGSKDAFDYPRLRMDKVKVIKPKTLIIWGKGDTSLISEFAEDSARLCHDATVVYLEGVSHWVQLQQPKDDNEAMKRFLREK